MLLSLVGCSTAIYAQVPNEYLPKPNDPYFKRFFAIKAPEPKGIQIRKGDRLAICGDSITEQKMYSRIIETYLTVCTPELDVSVRQFGWGGETAQGFLNRMQNDCLRFKPTIATTCYGMNDHGYRSYNRNIGTFYYSNLNSVVEKFQSAGTRVIVGSAGTVGKIPEWASSIRPGTDREDLNLNLCNLRNQALEIAQKHNAGFADVFWDMLVAGQAGKNMGSSYMLEGPDGVHPGSAGHLVMAYSFLHSFGLNGNIGTIDVDYRHKVAVGTPGHKVDSFDGSTVTVTSTKYPFCSPEGDTTSINSMRSAFSLVPFESELNRYTLRVHNAPREGLRVTWGETSLTFSSAQLERGVDLAAMFRMNPFSAPFAKVDAAVAQKQGYETRQIKQEFRSAAARQDMEAVVARTEAERAKLVQAIKDAFVPVTHKIVLSTVN